MYSDIKTKESTECVICQESLDGGDSPWSICYDPEWKHNCWGGDTHKYRALLCQDCMGDLLGEEPEPKKDEEDIVQFWPRSPQFIAFATFKKLILSDEVQLADDYKWHLMDTNEMPDQGKELLGWEYFSQLKRKGVEPRNTKLNSIYYGYYFDEVCWGDLDEDVHIPGILLFNHTLDIPILWSFVGLFVTAGGSITITRAEVVVD